VQNALKHAPAGLQGRPGRLRFQDEGRFGRINDTRRCWAPLPTRPLVGQQVVREYLYSFVAVCPFDGQFTSLTLPWADAQTMSIFLAHTAAQFAHEYGLMFLDGAGWHQAKDLRVPQNLKLIFLPPSSPQLNPAEHLWDHLRENHFGIDALTRLDQVAHRLAPGLQSLAAQPDLVRSLTLFDWIKPINLMWN